MTGFYAEDYELSRDISSVTIAEIVPSKARLIAGKWAAVKIRKAQQKASARGDWNQYYFLGDMAEDFERGDL